MQEQGKIAEDFIEREQEVFIIYAKLNKINQHKMMPIPVCEIPQSLK
jgi:NAD+ synthase